MNELSKDMITALVDGEITELIEKQKLLSKIESDKDFTVDFKMQNLVKDLIKEKTEFQKTPDKVRAQIFKSIGSSHKTVSSDKSFFPELFNKPSFTFITVFVVLLAIALIIINRPVYFEDRDFILQQHGSNNMFVQAQNNFSNILQGKLSPQFTSDNSDEIRFFFESNGVDYSVIVSNIIDWKLQSAFISEVKGKKLANQIYVNQENKIAYLYQADESYLMNKNIITLSNDLMKYLDEGNCYTHNNNNSITLFTKADNNICIVISNANTKEIEKIFCNMQTGE